MSSKVDLLMFITIVVGISAIGVSCSNATKFCPLSHKLNYDASCRICDQMNNKLLIEHFNLDTNKLELSIHDHGKILWIEHPAGKVKNFNGEIAKNTIKFDPNNDKMLIVNGERFPIQLTKNSMSETK